MRDLRSLAMLVGLGLSFTVATAAEHTPDATLQAEDEGGRKPDIAGRPVIVPPDHLAVGPSQPEHPPRPVKPGDPVPSDSVKALVKDFQEARREFLRAQELLREDLKKAAQEERAAIREALKENLAEWLAQQRSRMQELREQAREIREKVPSISEVVDSAREEGRGR